jgi:hypothetical protein
MPRRKKKKRFHTGVYVSTKTGQECRYRSGWELAYLQKLDSDPGVLSFGYETIVVPYVSNARSGKIRRYFPDFVVVRLTGTTIVEIKASRFLSRRMVVKKLEAGRSYAAAHGMTYEVLTEKELVAMGVLT